MDEFQDEVLQRLDTVIQLLKLGVAEELADVGERLRQDAAHAAILSLCADGWVSSSRIQEVVSKQAKVTDRTVRNRLTELVEAGVVQRRGTSPPEYRGTGLV